MERIANINTESFLNRKEHQIRYGLASRFAKGNILDIACGIGYGSEILLKNGKINTYHGMDVSAEAIFAAKQYEIENTATFEIGSICVINSADNAYDTLISFETLEHIQDPEIGIKEIVRVLNDDGIFIGSVPTKEFDELVEQIYGKNEFHISRFSYERLSKLLKKYFRTVKIFTYTVDMTMGIKELGVTRETSMIHMDQEYSQEESLYGSYFFICTKDEQYIDITNIDLTVIQSYFELVRLYQEQYNNYKKLQELYENKSKFYTKLEEQHQQLYKNYLEIHKLYEETKELKGQE